MIGGSSKATSLTQAKPKTHETFRYPAPVGGMDARQAIGSEDLNQCVYTFNLLPYEFGLQVRDGYRERQIGFEAGFGGGVRSLIPVDSPDEGITEDALYAVTNEGIWEASVDDTVPVLAVVFPDNTGNAGYGTFAHYVTDAAENIVYFADTVNGLYVLEAGVWSQATGISSDTPSVPLTAADIKFVVVHKERIWFVQRSSTIAFYLAIGAIQGTATPFFFGSKLRHGGTLEGLFNWTVDGGEGVDDLFVTVGHAGDVIVYGGLDPEDASWQIVGSFFIGELPNTPNFGTEQGGELYLLSTYGVTAMGDLLKGVDSDVLQSDVGTSGVAVKIAGLIRERMKASLDSPGWQMAMVPSEGGLLIAMPIEGAAAPLQFYYNLAARGWGFWRGVPMLCFQTYKDTVYFGTKDGRILSMDSKRDNVLLDPVDPNNNGNDIEFSVLTAYAGLGAPGHYKRPHLVRPDFLSTLPPSHSTQCRFDYDTKEAINTSTLFRAKVAVGVWGEGGIGISNWDEAVWGSKVGTTFPSVGGTWGTGRYVALATRGAGLAGTRLVGWDLTYEIGGVMI